MSNRDTLLININNWSSCDAMLGVDVVSTNVTVWCSICQPVVMPIVLDDFFHDAIGMDECPCNHGGRATVPHLLCSLPDTFCVSFVVGIKLQKFRMPFG